MGIVYLPCYANMFMTQFEEKHIYPHIKVMALLCLRYLDDILIIWKSTKEQLITLLTNLIKNIKLLNFNTKIPFLDTKVCKDKENNLQTTLYRKRTDQQSHRHAKS